MAEFMEEDTPKNVNSNNDEQRPLTDTQEKLSDTSSIPSSLNQSLPMQTSFIVHMLVCLFGIGSWVAVNGSFVELPILVLHLPEGWGLAAYVTVICQLANVGPAIYLLISRRGSADPVHIHRQEKIAIYVIISTGMVTCLLLVFFWKRTSYIGGEEYSTAFLTLVFFLALVDCTSSVLFLPYMSNLKPRYITTLYIGEGLSGFIPSLLAIGQGAESVVCANVSSTNASFINGSWYNETTFSIQAEYEAPRFPVYIFFILLFFMMLVCGVAFILLNYLRICKREHVGLIEEIRRARLVQSDTNPLVPDAASVSLLSTDESTAMCYNSITRESSTVKPEISQPLAVQNKTIVQYLILIAWINCLSSGVLPALQSYTSIPYGTESYHLSVTLSSLSNPLTSLLAFVLMTQSTVTITLLTGTGTGLAAYLICLASMSPHPVLADQTLGAVIMVSTWILVTATFTYSKVSIATVLRSSGKKTLLWCGIVTQVGSLLGAVITFCLVTLTHVFTSGSFC